MKRKLNNALGEMDQRFIEEAAEADRLYRRAPVWLKAALPTAGAAAVICVLALNMQHPDNGGVDLTSQPSADAAVSYADILSAAYPKSVTLVTAGTPMHETVLEAPEKPALLWADENTAVFTALGRCVYMYDLREGKLTHEIDVYRSLKLNIGNEAVKFQKGGISFGALTDGTPVVRLKLENGAVSYAIDFADSTMNQLNGKYELFSPEQFSESVVVKDKTIFGNEYIRLSDGSCMNLTNSDSTIADDGENALRVITLSRFTLDGDYVDYSEHIQPFTDEYMENRFVYDNVTTYKYNEAYLDFDRCDNTFEVWTKLPLNITPCGTYTVSGNTIALTFDDSGKKYTGSFATDNGGVLFRFDAADTIFSEIYLSSDSLKDHTDSADENDDASDVTEMLFALERGQPLNAGDVSETLEIITAHGFDEYIRNYLTNRMAVLGEEYNQQAAAALISDGASPLSEEYMTTREPMDRDPKTNLHNGTDLWSGTDSSAGTVGTDVFAFQSGTVVLAFDGAGSGSIGNYVLIDHGSGLATVYAGLGEVLVTEGQKVEKGETIARTGISGWSTSEHLHFEIRQNGEINDGTAAAEALPENADNIELQWPVVGDGGVISELMSGHGGYYAHKGIDISAPVGTPVLAAGSGTVINAEWYSGYGLMVAIDHGGIITVYGHLDKVNVSKGQQVAAGDVIGAVGSTGQTTGECLHFEVVKGSLEDGENLNPTDLLPEHEIASWALSE